MAKSQMSAEHAHALFHILTHEETYLEIRNLRIPGTLSHSGSPFVATQATQAQLDIPSAADQDGTKPAPSPILHRLFADFVTTLPGLKNVDAKFWPEKAQPLVEALSSANLSESYDKGSLALRKVLAIAISSMVEWAARGRFGKLPKQKLRREDAKYDITDPEDVTIAWDDLVQQLVYGDLANEIWLDVAKKPKLTDHRELVQAGHEYALVIFASVLHYIFIVSPNGPALMSLIMRINAMVPYFVLRQTLKIGNVASMISGVVNIFLAKVNMYSVTKWMGMHSGRGQGMNLLQQIISTIMTWDQDHMRKRLKSLERGTNVVTADQIKALQEYTDADRKLQTEYRAASARESKSIVSIIMTKASIEINEEQNTKALDYLAILLSIRDRSEMKRIFCHHEPDLLTDLIYDVVAAYEPMIRSVHKSIDLSTTVYDFEEFLKDLIKVARPGDGTTAKHISVEDFVRLAKRHQGSLHKFLHQAAKNAKDVAEWFRLYANDALALYRQDSSDITETCSENSHAAGAMTACLEEACASLSKGDLEKVLEECDGYVAYLKELNALSKCQMKAIITNVNKDTGGNSTFGPGMFLADWQDLFNKTTITPATLSGEVRHGSNSSVQEASRIDVEGKKKGHAQGETDARMPLPAGSEQSWVLLRKAFEKQLLSLDQK